MEIQEFLGMGNEGAVFKVREDGSIKLAKFFKYSIAKKRPLIDELNNSGVPSLLDLTYESDYLITYPWVELSPLPRSAASLRDVLAVVKELYSRTGLGHFDIDIERDNFMQDASGNVIMVDYLNAFCRIDEGNTWLYRTILVNAVTRFIDKRHSLRQGRLKKALHTRHHLRTYIALTFLQLLRLRLPFGLMFMPVPELIDSLRNCRYLKPSSRHAERIAPKRH